MFAEKKMYVTPHVKILGMDGEEILAGSGNIGMEVGKSGPEIPVVGNDTGKGLAAKENCYGVWDD